MTNEEAKDVLIEYRSDPKSKDWILKSKFPLALDVAIQALSDGWIRVEDVPTDKNIMKQADIFTEDEEGPYSRYSAFIAGAKWMKSKLIPSPPKI